MQEAIILAGGLGTRLRAVVQDVPKPMAPVNGRPFLSYVLAHCAAQGIRRVVLAIGYLGEQVQHYFGDTYEGMELVYSVEQEPLGTGGGIVQALAHCQDEPVFILNGDTLFNADFDALRAFYNAQRADFALALCPMEQFERYGVVEIDEARRVHAFHEKKYREKGLINAGVYLTAPRTILHANLPKKCSFERDFLEVQKDKIRMFGLPLSGYFIDIGVPEDYARAAREL